MAGNTFGTLFRVTTWGESHGRAIGAVIDGCPPGIEISQAIIQQELERRRPGKGRGESPRKEPDLVEIMSGTFRPGGKRSGAYHRHSHLPGYFQPGRPFRLL